MFRLVFIVLFAAATFVVSSHTTNHAAQRRRKSQPPRICFNPSVPCKTVATFEPHDLPFEISENSVIEETQFFYAIILKSIRAEDTDCERFISESERLQAQSLFPQHKVFTSRCGDPGTLYYTNVNPAQRFMAVYGGATRAEAARMLVIVKATGKFPGANIRRMRAGFNGT
jgi:hypothetical protein